VTETFQVGLGDRSYPITIGSGAWTGLVPLLEEGSFTSIMVVIDERVNTLYGEVFFQLIDKSGRSAFRFIVPEGEHSKSFRHLESLCREMARSGMDRESLVLALGGGVVGDLAGLAASIYLRGVSLVQLPTTLLSMVDSSVGGKTGINISEGKNLVGTFYQPEAVYADTTVLSTLHERDWYSGLAELIKVALVLDAELFNYLESVDDLGPSGSMDVTKTITAACHRKAEVVELDEREAGLRKVLNFGHTLGHGVEAALGYGELRHGEAILLGMRAALILSARRCGLPAPQLQRALALLKRIPIPEIAIPRDLASFMVRDKKSTGSTITGVLISEIGKHEFVQLEDPELLVKALTEV
jgi:3-dehydroquinate synthase